MARGKINVLHPYKHPGLCVRMVSIPKELLSSLDMSLERARDNVGHQEIFTSSPQTPSPVLSWEQGEKFAPNLSSSFQEKEKLTKDIVNHPSILFYYYYYFPDSENSTNGQWQCFQTEVTIMWKINCWGITLQCWNQISWLGFRKKK